MLGGTQGAAGGSVALSFYEQNEQNEVVCIDAQKLQEVVRLVNEIEASGEVGFHPRFAGRHVGPHALKGGRVKLHVFVDWSSVEVFADDGYTVLTDRIFPSHESDGVAVYATGGRARLARMDAWNLRSTWAAR